jgi:signal transduction histidine kinase
LNLPGHSQQTTRVTTEAAEAELPERLLALAARVSRAAGLPDDVSRGSLARLEQAVHELLATVEVQKNAIRLLETQNVRMDNGMRALRAASRVSESVASVFERERILAAIPGALARTFGAATARVWVVGKGDRCGTCPQAARCTDQKTCLHLVPFGERSLLDETLQRVPIGDFSVGRVAALGAQVATNDLAGDSGLANPAWARAEKIVSFAGHPLIHAGRLLGVVAMWSRSQLRTETLEALRILARHASTAIAGAELIDDVRRQSARSEAATGRLESLLEASRSGVIMFDPGGRAAYVNGAFRRLFGLGDLPLVGMSRADLETVLRPKLAHPATVLPGETSAKSDSAAPPDDELLLRAPGEATCRVVRGYSANVHSITGESQGSMSVFDDITEAREVDRMKTEFIGTVSHELRTPLTSIKGSLGLLLDGSVQLDPEIAELLQVSKRNVDRLVRLVNDILDLSKIEAGNLELQPQPIAPERLCKDSVSGVGGFAQRVGVTIECDVPLELPKVRADPDRVVQVLTNLLSNALKFSPRGAAVDLTARHQDGAIRFEVIDRGPGIPLEFRDKLFTRFAQADRQLREQEGTGLGLAISQALVLGHGGQIGCNSEPGQGATLWFTLPVVAEGEGPR